MRINHNITALNTYNKLTANQATTAKSLEKLSSGLKINRAGDNAAGLAISEKMRGQIRGLDTATSNANDGISLIKTAEGGLNETHSILQRMRELAVQSANDTNTDADRTEIQKEVSQLTSEINRISKDTEFNTRSLLNGESGVKISITGAAANAVGTADTKAGSYVVTSSVLAKGATDASNGTYLLATTALGATSTLSLNGKSYSFTTANDVQDVLDAVNTESGSTGVTATFTPGAAITFTTNAVGSSAQLNISGTGDFSTVADASGTDAVLTLGSGFTGTASASGNNITMLSGNEEGLSFTVTGIGTSTMTVDSNNSLKMQIGANATQNMSVSINDMSATALGVGTVDVSTQTKADTAITTIDDAITTVSSERAKLGAYQNRLEHTINNLGTQSENTASAESRIRDVDMAKEMMEFTKSNILSQAAQSMLAQANQQPQGVLQLLQ